MKVNEHVKTTILEDIVKRCTPRTISKKFNLALETKPDDIARLNISLLSSDPSYWSVVYSNLFEFRADKIYLLLDRLIHNHKVFTPFDLENFRVQFALCLASYLQCSVNINNNNSVYYALNFLQFEEGENLPPKQYGIFSPLIDCGILNEKEANLLQRKFSLGINPSIPDGEYVQWNGSLETLISWLICCHITGKLHIGCNKIKRHTRDTNKYQWPAVFWNATENIETEVRAGDIVDMAYSFNRDCWRRIETPQLLIRDIRKSVT